MSAEVVDIHDRLSTAPPVRHEEPCPVVTLPVVRIERAPFPTPADLPCDVEPEE